MLARSIFFTVIFFLFLSPCTKLFAQQATDSLSRLKADTVVTKNFADSGKSLLALDTTSKKFDPRKATFRSLVLPGWGQAYNRKYWKIPIVYGALGTTAGVFLYNLKTYKLLRKAVILRSDTIPGNDNQVAAQFQGLSTESIRIYRNAFRQNIDYSVLVFLVFWGLNVVDATVDAHLKAFDVSSDIGMKLRPGFNYTTNSAGMSLVFFVKDKSYKTKMPLP
jgi:hypothetical protein